MPLSRIRRARRDTVRDLGRLDLLLARDRVVYARWPEAAPPRADRIAAVAAVDWVVRTTVTSSPFTPRQVAGLLERVCRSASAAEYAERCGTTRLVDAAPPIGTVGPTISVSVQEISLADGALETVRPSLRLDWIVPHGAATVSTAERVLAALWVIAEDAGHGESVQHALYTVRGGFEESGPFPDGARDTLVASLLRFGVEIAGTEERARTSRSAFTVVRD